MSQHVHTTGTVLVPMLNLGVATDLIQMAGTLALGMQNAYVGGNLPLSRIQSRVVVVGVVEVPHDQPLTTGLVLARSYRALLDFLPSEVEVAGKRVRVERIVKVARDVASAVHDAALDEDASLVMLYWKGYARHARRHTYGRTADAIMRNSPCDVALVRPEAWANSRRITLTCEGRAICGARSHVGARFGQANFATTIGDAQRACFAVIPGREQQIHPCGGPRRRAVHCFK